jgi:hypothetical protein
LLLIFGPLYKQNKKKRKKGKYKKIKNVGRIYIYIYSEKSIPKRPGNCQRLVEKDQIYKIGKFNSVFLTNEGSTGKENSI